MTARALLARLDRDGTTAWTEGGRLHLRGRQPTPDLLAELRASKAEVLALLATPDPDPPAACRSAAAPDPEDWTPAVCAIRAARLPPLGSPERGRLDREQAAMCVGLLAGYRRHAGGAS